MIEILKKVATEIGDGEIEWREVNILNDPEYAVQLGVLSTPSIAIDGKLVFRSLPSKKQLRVTLEKRLNNEVS